MSAVVTFNPRRRSSRKKARRRRARAASNPVRRRRRRYLASSRPVARRRRRLARHNPRRRVRRNPAFRIPGLGGELGRTVSEAAGIGAGMAVYDFATDWLAARLPANLQSGPMNLVVKAGVGLVALPALARMLPMTKGLAKPIAIGAGALLVYELYQRYLAPQLAQMTAAAPASTTGYGTRQISGYGATLPESSVSGIYSGMYS